MHRLFFWGLVGLTLAVYGVMLARSLPTVSAAAGGLTPFDMRPGGYSFEEARAFLLALSADGAAFYSEVQQRLDIAYPALIALTLGLSIAALLPRRIGRWRWLALGLAAPVAVFDYLENHAIALMIEAGAGALTAAMVEEASGWTVLKSTASTIVMSALLCLLVVAGVRRLWRAHRSRSASAPA